MAVALPIHPSGYVVRANTQSNTCSSSKGLWSYCLLGRVSTPCASGNGAGKKIPPFAREFWQKVRGLDCCWRRCPEHLYQSFAVIWLFVKRWGICSDILVSMSCCCHCVWMLHFSLLLPAVVLVLLSSLQQVDFTVGDGVCFVFWSVFQVLQNHREWNVQVNDGERCCCYGFNHAFVFQVQLETLSANPMCG